MQRMVLSPVAFVYKYKKKVVIVLAIFLCFMVTILTSGIYFGLKTITNSQSDLRFGAVGDFEYGYRENVGNKLTRLAPVELEKVVNLYNAKFFPKFVVALGDMVESSGIKPEKAKKQFQEINAIFSKLSAEKKYVLGNHDLRSLSKEEVRQELGLADNHSYFDEGDWRFVIMDTNFDKDRNGADMGPDFYVAGFVSESEFSWLREAFQTDKPIVIFSHHPPIQGEKNLKNYKVVQAFFEQFPNIVLVVSAHDPNFKFSTVNGISYLVVDNLANKDSVGSFATLEVRYNTLLKKAKIQIEHYGPTRRSVEVGKNIPFERKWWVDILSFFNLV